MTKQTTFKIATKDGAEECAGKVALLSVGDKRHRFIIHDDTLSDYRSGFRFGSLNGVKIAHMCARGHAARMTDRTAAQTLIDRTVAQVGLEKVVATLAKPPTLNA